MDFVRKRLEFENADGEIVSIYKPSVIRQEEIRSRFEELIDLSNKKFVQEKTFQEAYFGIKKYRRAVNLVFELAGIDPKSLDPDMMVSLLFPHEAIDEEGNEVLVTQGELLTFIFGPPGNHS